MNDASFSPNGPGAATSDLSSHTPEQLFELSDHVAKLGALAWAGAIHAHNGTLTVRHRRWARRVVWTADPLPHVRDIARAAASDAMLA